MFPCFSILVSYVIPHVMMIQVRLFSSRLLLIVKCLYCWDVHQVVRPTLVMCSTSTRVYSSVLQRWAMTLVVAPSLPCLLLRPRYVPCPLFVLIGQYLQIKESSYSNISLFALTTCINYKKCWISDSLISDIQLWTKVKKGSDDVWITDNMAFTEIEKL